LQKEGGAALRGVYQFFSPHRDGTGYFAHDDTYRAVMGRGERLILRRFARSSDIIVYNAPGNLASLRPALGKRLSVLGWLTRPWMPRCFVPLEKNRRKNRFVKWFTKTSSRSA